jgi:peroxiredoxin
MKIRIALVAASLMASTLAPVALFPSAIAAMADGPGIAMGAKAPVTLALRDAAGKPTTLAARIGAKGIVVVMVRSADWCPYCKAQLIGLNGINAKIKAMGYSLASVSYDKPAKLAGFASAKGITYSMLSDEGSKLIDAVRLRDPQYASVPFANGVPYATVLVLAKDGTVKAKNVSLDYTVRPTNEAVIAMVQGVKS